MLAGKAKLNNLANALTLLRIGLIPFIILSFYINSVSFKLIAALLFMLACITDYLDGFVARTFNQQSRFGEMLDPIADKLLVATTLLLLVGFNRISKFSIIAAVIILSREILVSGLREYLAKIQINLPVTWLAKTKTALQMVAIGLLLYKSAELSFFWQIIGELLLWGAAIITLYTGAHYVKACLEITQAD